jgi:hypothetical protein
MGLFSGLGKLGRAAIGTALLPVDVARDAFTLGDGQPSKTGQRIAKIGSNVGDALDEIDEDDDA